MPSWELRTGGYRVFYDVDELNRVVEVLRAKFKGRRTTKEVLES